MKNEYQNEQGGSSGGRKRVVKGECGPGLSEILAIPEAFLNKEISTNCLKSYIAFEKQKKFNIGATSSYEHPSMIREEQDSSTTTQDDKIPAEIEQGTDLLSPTADINALETKTITINGNKNYKKQISRSVGSYTDEECCTSQAAIAAGSDPSIAIANVELPSSLENGQQEYLKKWLDSGPIVCSEENLYPDEVIGATVPLTTRTDALLNTKSFNLVKPKYE